jgi:molybdopterin/thiamine biosynthesis adenylyltransferase
VSSGAEPQTRLAWELEQLAAVGITARPVEDGRERRIEFELPFLGEPHAFSILLGPLFPDAPPKLHGPVGLLARHQEPDGGHLCVVDDLEHWWRPNRPVADLIEPLRGLLEATATGPEAVAAGELARAEPVSGYLSFRENHAVLIPEELLELEIPATAGTFRIRRVDGERLGVLTELHDTAGNTVVEIDPSVLNLTADDGKVGGWVALAEPPTVDDSQDVLLRASGHALEIRDGKRAASSKRAKRRDHASRSRITAVTFLEEGGERDEKRRTWIVAETRGGGHDPQWVRGKPLRTQVIGRKQRLARSPELDGLARAAVLVVGAGSLGSAVAVELAKAGVGKLAILDYDVYEAGNAVRHVLPVTDAGQPKVPALTELCQAMNPFVEIRPLYGAIGGAQRPEDLDLIVGDVDLVIDATGSHAVTRMLQTGCARQGTILVSAALGVGGYGARVVVLKPYGPCFDCFLLALDDETILPPLQGPPVLAIPAGCRDPAASCAGFDVTHAAAVAARTVVRALHTSRYPEIDHDWVTMNFRGDGPFHEQGALAVHANCPRAHGP